MSKCYSFRGGYRKPKFYYPTESAAVTAAQRTSEQYGAPMRAYLCPDCQRWHVGSIPARYPHYRSNLIERFAHMAAAIMRGNDVPDLVTFDGEEVKP